MPHLTVHDLQVAYPQHSIAGLRQRHKVVVDRVSFSVPVGCTAILGDNGTGKTSLLLGVIDSRARVGGTVLLDGKPLGRGEVGYVPQSAALTLSPWLTVAQECTLSRRIAGEPRRTRYSDLRSLLIKLDISLPLERRVDRLSGGQRELVALVRALMVPTTTKLFVFDEPYEGLSERARCAVTRVLTTLAQTHPVLATSHRVEDLVRLDATMLQLVGEPATSLEPVDCRTVKGLVAPASTMSLTGPLSSSSGTNGDVVTSPRSHVVRSATQAIFGVLLGVVVWWLAARALDHPGLLPEPIGVFRAAFELVTSRELGSHLWATMARALGSWTLAMALAVPMGVLIGYYEALYRLAAPWVSVARCVPVFALAGTAIGLFPGMPDTQRVVLITCMLWLVALQIMSLSTYVAPRRRLHLSRLFGAGVWFRLRHVLLNEVRGGVLAAAETTLPISIIVTLVVEVTLLPRHGLGQYVYNHMTDANLSTLWAFLLVPAVIAAVAVLLIRLAAGSARREL